jgi:hypothetical protein
MLNTYLQQTQTLLNDTSETSYNRSDLISYINEARSQIAGEAQCVRGIPFVGTVQNIFTSTNGSGGTVGTGYPLTFTGGSPTTTATGTYDVQSDGTVTNIVITDGGTGYISIPTVGFGGSGFSSGVAPLAAAFLSTGILCVPNQEVYEYSSVDLSNIPGVSAIIAVRSVAILWNTYRFVANRVSFSKYQALIRTYANNFSDVPRVMAQFGQGENGSLYFYPIPNSNYIMEWDCIFDVAPLVDNTTFEAIPNPWRTPVQYYAASKAFEGAGDLDRSERMFQRFERFMKRGRAQASPGGVANWYGRR